jgi:hypothetical protein
MHQRPTTVSLDLIEIANPCPASWDKMRGDDRVRFCDQCQLNVYNISAMPREEAIQLLARRGETRGRLCVRLYKRADGTVITADCGGGLRAAAKRAAKLAGTAAALVLGAALTPILLGATASGSRDDAWLSPDPMATLKTWIAPLFPRWFAAPPPPPIQGRIAVMGGAPPLPQPPATQPARVEMGDVAQPPQR